MPSVLYAAEAADLIAVLLLAALIALRAAARGE